MPSRYGNSNEDWPIEGALTYEAARASGRRVLFLTNNSSKDGRHYVDKLNRMGCPVTQDDVYTSGMATCQMLRREYPGVPVYLLGNESLRGEFERYGIPLCDRQPGLVVVGFDTTLDYRKLCVVCDFVGRATVYRDASDSTPDRRSPTRAILVFEASTGRRPDRIVGKPHADIVRGMLE